MDPVEASSFYTGLVADLYSPLKSSSYPAGDYADLIAASGEPALELGCGDGDPLLDLRERGLDVDGVDSSPDMIARLHTRAADRGLTVNATVMRMEDIQPTRRYRTVFLAGPTFNLLPTDEHMARALRSIHRCLTADGAAVVPLFAPAPPAAHEIGRPRRQTTRSGWISVTTTAVDHSETARAQRLSLRYERQRGAERESLDRVWLLHWITPHDFAAIAVEAGLGIVALPDEIGPEPADAVLRRARAAAPA